MTDIFDVKTRSRIMSRIKSQKTKPEMDLKKYIRGLGFSYQPKNIDGNPDFVHHEKRIVIFVNGCFWHGCPKHFKMPKSNKGYWMKKINKNALRDKINAKILKLKSYKVLSFWEHELGGSESCAMRVKRAMK